MLGGNLDNESERFESQDEDTVIYSFSGIDASIFSGELYWQTQNASEL